MILNNWSRVAFKFLIRRWGRAILKKRADLQSLRGVAILSVLFFHANDRFFPNGYLGVDVFFVISGFVVTPMIMRIYQNPEKNRSFFGNLKYFYMRRFYRLAPALSATLILSSIIFFFLGNINDFQKFSKQGIATIFLLGNFGAYAFSGNYFAPNPNPLIHTWSLSVEEQLYLLLPLLILVLSIFRPFNNNLKFKISIFLILSSFSFSIFMIPNLLTNIYSAIGIQNSAQFAFYNTAGRFWQFALGSLIYFSRYKIIKIILPLKLILVLSLFCILFLPFHIDIRLGSLFSSFAAALVIHNTSLNLLPINLQSAFCWAGDRSYSLYLIHMPIFYFARFSDFYNLATPSRNLEICFSVPIVFILGNFLYSNIEQRFRLKWKLNWAFCAM